MASRDSEAAPTPSTADVSPSLSSAAFEKRLKKRSKKPSKDTGDDTGKKESALEISAHSATKTPKDERTGTPVTTTGGEKRVKKHSKKQKDVGEAAAKDESALQSPEQTGTKTKTPDAGAVVSSSKADLSAAQSPAGADEKRRSKSSKRSSTTSYDETRDRPTASEAAHSPVKPKDARPQSSAGRSVATRPAQAAPTTSAEPVPAQGNAKGAASAADLPAFEGRNYTRIILMIIGAVVLAIGVLGAIVVYLFVFRGRGSTNGTRTMSTLTDVSTSSSFAAPSSASWRSQPLPVSTTSGEFVGKTVSVGGVEVNCWLGIPYAESTAGNNRFHKPVPRVVKERTLARDPRPPCPQWVNGTVVGSEDCLHVNVWAPNGNSAAGSKRTLVLASSGYWFQRGSNNDPDWAQLAAKADMVVMSPNVRVGVLGFLHPERLDNKGFVKDVAKEDAKAAVKWAVANAAAFGARSDGVVLVGHGSGAYVLIEAVHSLNIKCSRAILEGPVPGSLWPLNTGVLEPSRYLATFMNCIGEIKTPISRPCLANTSVEALLSEAARLEFRFAPSLEESQLISKDPPLEIPEVIAGVDIDQVRTFFDEYVRPLAVATGHASPLAAVLDFTLTYFLQNGSRAYNTAMQGLSAASLATESHLLNGLALYMGGCDTRSLVQTASLKGFHYITDGAGKPLFEPVLDMAAVVNFIKDGSVPRLKNGQPWEPWKSSNTTRVELVADTGAPTKDQIANLCKRPY